MVVVVGWMGPDRGLPYLLCVCNVMGTVGLVRHDVECSCVVASIWTAKHYKRCRDSLQAPLTNHICMHHMHVLPSSSSPAGCPPQEQTAVVKTRAVEIRGRVMSRLAMSSGLLGAGRSYLSGAGTSNQSSAPPGSAGALPGGGTSNQSSGGPSNPGPGGRSHLSAAGRSRVHYADEVAAEGSGKGGAKSSKSGSGGGADTGSPRAAGAGAGAGAKRAGAPKGDANGGSGAGAAKAPGDGAGGDGDRGSGSSAATVPRDGASGSGEAGAPQSSESGAGGHQPQQPQTQPAAAAEGAPAQGIHAIASISRPK